MKCLVAIVDPERDRAVVDLAVALAAGEELILISPIEVPEGDTLASVQPEARRLRRTLDQLVPAEARARTLVTVARQGWQAVQETVASERPDLLLLTWRRPGWDLLGTTIEDVLRNPPCDIAVVKGQLSRARRILVPVRGGRYADLAAKVAIGWARAKGGSVTLLHVRTPGRRTPTLYQLLGERALDDRVDRLVTRTGDPAEVINEELAEHDAIAFGATGRKDQEDPLGPVGQAIVASARAAVVVRTATPFSQNLALPLATLPADRAERSKVVGEIVDKWFVQNTFSSSEFADLRRLLEAKERQNLRISVGLPTLNEEATVRRVIRAIRSRLMERIPLVDEIAVIDSDSDDQTREIAREEGVPVHVLGDVLPDYGARRGKGEALWKSLHVLTGDIVVWIDTDVTDTHPKFVYGILGPLLLRPDVQFVKAFYQRPLRIGAEVLASGGGRVTELSARPILNLFFPELSGMVQPLSGEQGGRRTLLEQLPFFTGYGVETGLLIDTLLRAGLGALAQVDMKHRIHRNQDLLSLSKMSFQILQVALKRVGEAHGGRIWEEANATLKLITQTEGGKLHLEMHDIEIGELPPMATIPEYITARRR
ncbi:MAG TPA: glucosyl-3-phosphoglycerate synthase [Candidatus Limnocylindria bacterium]|jgi:glucosyl-3-phosphoglycerate synthase|nr:glucosyl-3-phosphoglycerate synthase [Candidatus Limnocylindria bacterium]